MLKAIIGFAAILSLAFAGVLVATPKRTISHPTSIAAAGIDTFSLTGGVRDLPEQSYPAY